MINNYLIVFFLLVVGSKMSAQYDNRGRCPDCFYSFEVGMAVSDISGMDNTSAKAGFHAGYYYFVPIVYEKFDVRTGMSYTSVGAKVKDYKTPLVIHSINIPLTFHYRPIPKFQVFVGGGK